MKLIWNPRSTPKGWTASPIRSLIAAHWVWIAALVAIPAAGTNQVSGHFTAEGCRFEPSHIYAVQTPSSLGTGEDTMMILTRQPLDLDLAYAVNPRQTALEDLTLAEPRAEMGLIVTITNGIANHFFWCTKEPPTTVQISGHEGEAVFALGEETRGRIAGDWTLEEKTTSFGESVSWALRFAVDITDPTVSAKKLSKSGGKVGKAYLRYLKDLRKGNVAAVRTFINNPWFLKATGTEKEIAEDLEMIRAREPKQVKISGGLADEGAAILEIESTLDDGTTATLRVLLKKVDGHWVDGGWRE